MTIQYQPVHPGNYSIAIAAMDRARADVWHYGYDINYRHLLGQGMPQADAERAAYEFANGYADQQMKRFAFIGPWFWVCLALAPLTLGVSSMWHWAIWTRRRKQLLGVGTAWDRWHSVGMIR